MADKKGSTESAAAPVSAFETPPFESPIVRAYPTSGASASAASTSGDSLTLTDLSATTKWLIRADADGQVAAHLGVGFATSATAPGGALVLGSRPGEWIAAGTPEQVSSVVSGIDALAGNGTEAAASAELVTHLDWTHGRALFRLTGANAARLLEKVCGLDWSDHMTPDGAVASASVALVTCDLARNDLSDSDRADSSDSDADKSDADDSDANNSDAAARTPSYLIFCDRSFAQYLFDALADAGTEFGLATSA